MRRAKTVASDLAQAHTKQTREGLPLSALHERAIAPNRDREYGEGEERRYQDRDHGP